MTAARQVEPTLFVIMGGTGDLARRKLLPALARQVGRGLLAKPCLILGAARSADHTDQSFRAWVREALAAGGLSPAELGRWRDDNVYYQSIGDGTDARYEDLATRIEELERQHNLPGNRTFYLALPPSSLLATIEALGRAGLARSAGWTRLVIEKPFGRDLASGQQLNRLVHRYFEETQIYRIDHYLGKETVQNLLVFRFSNPIFEALWNRDRVECVQITVAEELGIGTRAGYYEQAGALRDIVQNHLTQLVTLIGMEVPSAFEADAIRHEKVKVLRSMMGIGPEDVVFGQYTSGTIHGGGVRGYREEPGVAPDSETETFVAMRLHIDSWRWQGVPFYVRTGKRLRRRLTEIAVVFRRPPVCLFQSFGACLIHSNVLLMTLQPEEGFYLFFDVKKPGDAFELDTLPLHFQYQEAFGPLPDAYETLLLDVLIGDQTLFVHADEVEGAWKLYTPLFERAVEVHPYRAGTWGPPQADRLLDERGHTWQLR